ncbi:hypothetical protein VTK56DRAFT_3024 [Thermocarpiscus australiensis]
MDIEDKCARIDQASDSVLSPVSSASKAFQRLRIGQNTAPLRDNKRRSESYKEAATRRRKQKPRSRIPCQNLERQLYNRTLEIVPGLIRHDIITFFTNHFERALNNWVSILMGTTIPDNAARSDPCVINAFKLLDSARADGDIILSRLAYIRLAHIFELVKKIVASDRRNGLLPARISGYRNASVAVGVFSRQHKFFGFSFPLFLLQIVNGHPAMALLHSIGGAYVALGALVSRDAQRRKRSVVDHCRQLLFSLAIVSFLRSTFSQASASSISCATAW